MIKLSHLLNEDLEPKDVSKPGRPSYWVYNDEGWTNKILVGKRNLKGMLNSFDRYGYKAKKISSDEIEFYDNGDHFATLYHPNSRHITLEHDGTVDDSSYKRKK